jgi:hypothetical protein
LSRTPSSCTAAASCFRAAPMVAARSIAPSVSWRLLFASLKYLRRKATPSLGSPSHRHRTCFSKLAWLDHAARHRLFSRRTMPLSIAERTYPCPRVAIALVLVLVLVPRPSMEPQVPPSRYRTLAIQLRILRARRGSVASPSKLADARRKSSASRQW